MKKFILFFGGIMCILLGLLWVYYAYDITRLYEGIYIDANISIIGLITQVIGVILIARSKPPNKYINYIIRSIYLTFFISFIILGFLIDLALLFEEELPNNIAITLIISGIIGVNFARFIVGVFFAKRFDQSLIKIIELVTIILILLGAALFFYFSGIF
tara:strand:+ start:318 stop:794 length:477 start_codon:yes stop_codon:yes gene_type:complete